MESVLVDHADDQKYKQKYNEPILYIIKDVARDFTSSFSIEILWYSVKLIKLFVKVSAVGIFVSMLWSFSLNVNAHWNVQLYVKQLLFKES